MQITEAHIDAVERAATPPQKVTLTRVQADVYHYVKDFIEKNGYGPTIREIALAVNRSHGNVHRYLVQIEKRGWIARPENTKRGYILL